MRILARRPATLRVRVDDEDGNLVDATTVTATVRRYDSTIVLDEVVAEHEAVGTYAVPLDAQTLLDLLDVEWIATVDGETRTITDRVEVVGGRLVELWQLREHSELANLSGDQLRSVLTTVEDVFTAGLGFPPFPRPFRSRVSPTGVVRLLVPHLVEPRELFSVSVAGSELDVAAVRVGAGDWLEQTSGALWLGDVDVWGSWGWTIAPADVGRAAIAYAKHLARESNVPDRATQIATEGAVITLAIPSLDRPTGLPDVDATLLRHRVAAVI